MQKGKGHWKLKSRVDFYWALIHTAFASPYDLLIQFQRILIRLPLEYFVFCDILLGFIGIYSWLCVCAS